MQHADNPLRAGLEMETTPAPCAFVIFGASGDLTRRKLVPAIYNLAVSRLLPPAIAIVGVAITPMSTDEFRAKMRDGTAQFSRRKPLDESVWTDFASRLHYIAGAFDEDDTFRLLKQKLDELDREHGTRQNRIFYLAIPPSTFTKVNDHLSRAGLVARHDDPERYTRIIVEKPFGRDFASGEALNADLHRVFHEQQIFRIDHYLGKETVQNLMAFRFGNEIFEPLWNRQHVDHVQITVAEDIGVEGRGRFYEEAGATRDIVQNHLLQLLMVTAMEPPVAFDADAVRDEKVKVLRGLRPIVGEDAARKLTVRGQYGPGNLAGQPVPGYRQEKDVAPTSNVETFVAMKLGIDSWRWEGVPFYIRAGKRMTKRATEITIHFARVPHALLVPKGSLERDVLALRIQPNEGISLHFVSKVPGPTMTLRAVNMDFNYGRTFGSTPEAYERLLLDAMRGDPTLFARSDEVTAAWRFVSPILDAWKGGPPSDFPNYAAGTWGPPDSAALLEQDGRHWRRL